MSLHVPVLGQESVDLLVGDPSGRYVDCTLGDGGHSSLLLARLSADGVLVGLDRDPDAIRIAGARLGEDARLRLCRRAFADLDAEPETEGASGFLFDLGVSSRQLDEDARGFTIRPGVPLDMRMDPGQEMSLVDVIRSRDEDALARDLVACGDVDRARTIARFLVERARVCESLTSDDLAGAIDAAFPRGLRDRTRELARLAQALRILVNGELEQVERGVSKAFARLRPGGRLCVITYHSIEDRLVKRTLRGLIGEDAPRDIYGRRPEPAGTWVAKRMDPGPEEVARNPRARSAQLRAVEKTRGAALGGILVGLLAASLLSAVLVGQIWRQNRHMAQERSLETLGRESTVLRDSARLLASRLESTRSRDRVAQRVAALGFAPPERQWRLSEPPPLASAEAR